MAYSSCHSPIPEQVCRLSSKKKRADSREGCLSLFLPSSESILEVQAVSPPDGRSWFLKEEVIEGVFASNAASWYFANYVPDGRLVMMTPIDPAFLLLRLLDAGQVCLNVLRRHWADSRSQTDVFRTADDLFEELSKKLGQLAEETEKATLERSLNTLWGLPCILRSLRLVCDVKGKLLIMSLLQPCTHPFQNLAQKPQSIATLRTVLGYT